MSGLPILAYHGLDASGSPISTHPERFAAQMAALASEDWRTVDLGDWIAAGRPPVERGFALTFDDGICSTLDAADVLARHGFTATLFLVAGRMGGDNAWPGQTRGIPRLGLLSWSEAAGLRAAGFRFGAHTLTHPRLDRLDDEALQCELRGPRERIEDRLGTPCRLLAYPYGSSNPRVRRAASRHYAAAFGTRLDRAGSGADPFDLPRIDAYEVRTPAAFAALLEGRESSRFRVRRLVRSARRRALDLARASA